MNFPQAGVRHWGGHFFHRNVFGPAFLNGLRSGDWRRDRAFRLLSFVHSTKHMLPEAEGLAGPSLPCYFPFSQGGFAKASGTLLVLRHLSTENQVSVPAKKPLMITSLQFPSLNGIRIKGGHQRNDVSTKLFRRMGSKFNGSRASTFHCATARAGGATTRRDAQELVRRCTSQGSATV